MAIVLLSFATPAFAKNGAFKSTAHGDRAKGPARRADAPRGSCVQCHDGHASHDGAAGQQRNAALFAANDNEFCFRCHSAASERGLFAGSAIWSQSTHGLLDASVSPTNDSRSGPLPCLVCHDPHGVRDANGLIPALARSRSDALCGQCHDGSRGSNIREQLTRGFVHGAQARGEHSSSEDDDPSGYAAAPMNRRHVDCADCHNVHSGATQLPGRERSADVSRVEVDPLSTASSLRFTFRRATDRTPSKQQEICFKCHSSWTKQPARQPDLAQLTLPQNPSYHPIQAEGKNRRIESAAFVPGYGVDSLITCTDCHGSDDSRERGLHGSRNEHLLRRPYADASGFQTGSESDLCFGCHAFAVYASGTASSSQLAASRFNEPAGAGHVFHVSRQQISCAACHDPHGSTRFPALVVRASGRGITNYTQSATGGTCQTTCHPSRSYTVNYPR